MAPQLCDLPPEILVEIISYLPTCDKKELRFVNQRLKSIVGLVKEWKECPIIIGAYNVKEIKSMLDNNIVKGISFENLLIKDMENADDIKHILEIIGKKIRKLKIEISDGETVNAIDFNNMKYLKRLEIAANFETAEIQGVIDKVLDFLKRLLEAPPTIRLRDLKLNVINEVEHIIIPLLIKHGKTMEEMKLYFYDESIFDCEKWEQVFAELHNLKYLTIVGAVSSQFFESLISSLPSTVHLKYVYTSFMWHSTKLAYILRRWSHSITSLNLMCFFKISEENLHEIAKMRNLYELDVGYSELTKTELMNLIKTTNTKLQKLALNDIKEIDEEIAQNLSMRFRTLTSLNLSNCVSAVTNRTLSYIFCNLTLLENLELSGCLKISNRGITGYGAHPYPISRLRGLKSLNLQYCRVFDDGLITSIILPELRKFDISYCKYVTSRGIEKMVENCPAIEHLHINSCCSLDTNAIFLIGTKLKRLKYVNLSFLDELDNNLIMEYLLTHFKSLKSIGLNGFTTEFTEFLSSNKPLRITTEVHDEFIRDSVK